MAANDAAARERRIGLICTFTMLFIWTGFMLVSRLGARATFTPWDIALLRYTGAAFAIIPVIAIHGWPRIPPGRAAALVFTASIGFPLAAYAGFQFAPAAHGGVLLPGTLPVMVALLGWAFFGAHWTRSQLAALALVIAGVALLGRDAWDAHPGAWRGDLLLLLACANWGLYTLLMRRWNVAALDAVIIIAATTLPVYLPFWYFALPTKLGEAPWGAAAFQLFYHGILAVVVALFLFNRALAALGAMTLTTITAVVPGLAALLAWPLLGERLGLGGLLGVALVSAAMVSGVVAARAR